MRILILGGTAFLSAEIARQAVADGHNVTCLARGSTAAPPAGAHWIRADRSEGAAAYAEAAREWDAVIDVARDPQQAGAALESLGDRAAAGSSPVFIASICACCSWIALVSTGMTPS